MEYIYFAVSDSHPGMVKIGRTDRPVAERMSELSEEDYGLSNFEGDSTWEAVEVIKVKDNVEAERVLHEHFEGVRVEDGREIFYSDDVNGMAIEGAEVADGTSIDILGAGVDESSSIFENFDGILEGGIFAGGEPAEILEGQSEVIDGIIEFGVLGVGIAGAAIAYNKYKDEEVVKDAVSTAKQLSAEGKKKWEYSAKTRKQILDTSAEVASEVWESSTKYSNKVKTAGKRLLSKVKNK